MRLEANKSVGVAQDDMATCREDKLEPEEDSDAASVSELLAQVQQPLDKLASEEADSDAGSTSEPVAQRRGPLDKLDTHSEG